MANFDSGYFYQITLQSSAITSLCTQQQTSNGTGSVFFQITNTTQSNQEWQLFNAENDTYVLRSGSSGPWGYMVAVEADTTSDTNTGNTVPASWNVANITDDSMYWTIKPWGDGSFYFENSANGTEWHLQLENNGLMTMSSNITAPQVGQQFIFNKLGKIKNSAFATIALPPSSTSSSKATQTSISLSGASSSSSSLPSSSSSSHGLSTAAVAGIAASIGALAILCIVLGILLFFRRRKNQRAATATATAAYSNVYDGHNTTEGKSPIPWSAAPQYNYAQAAYSPNLYPSAPVQSPPAVPVFAELSQEAQQPTPELGNDGQIYQSYKSPSAKGGTSNVNSPTPQQSSPIEMDAVEHGRLDQSRPK